MENEARRSTEASGDARADGHSDSDTRTKADKEPCRKLRTGTFWLTRIVILRYLGFIYCVVQGHVKSQYSKSQRGKFRGRPPHHYGPSATPGFPDQIVSDNGTQFVSDLMKEIYKLLSIKSVHTSPYHAQSNGMVVEKEVKTMLELGVIEPSKPNYCSPVVLVSKKDGSVRFCIDFRALNKVTLFDAEPIPDTEELFCRLNGILKPEPGKVQKILDIAKPVSKRQVRSLLGLIGYYRRYVPNFATLTAPLSDLTRADRPRKITWTAECDDALRAVQRILATFPVLLIPDLSKEFIVRTDASNSGLGAVLLQDKDGLLHPVAFVSRKLLDQETRYSTIERECLAIVWSLTKLSRYLWGREFVLQTDHRPLSYLTSGKFKNCRITRWALALQEFRFRIEPVQGKLNVFADCLSRSGSDQLVV
nr:hypothetical protein BaRGS_031003 [Batillaria attramentaria]